MVLLYSLTVQILLYLDFYNKNVVYILIYVLENDHSIICSGTHPLYLYSNAYTFVLIEEHPSIDRLQLANDGFLFEMLKIVYRDMKKVQIRARFVQILS